MESTVSLDHDVRWMRDGLHECVQAGGFETLDVDVTHAQQVLRRLKATRHVTWVHVFVRAVAIALSRNPDLNQLVAGNKKFKPDGIDICLSVAGDSSVTPVVIIENSGDKDIFTIAEEVVRRTPEAVKEGHDINRLLKRWGWVIPISFLRRGLLGFLLRRVWYRRKVSGTFQVTCVPSVDVTAPLLFNTSAALGIGRVRDKVVAMNGIPTVRTVVTLTCCIDHAVCNGMTAARFLTSVREVLESGEFVSGAAQIQPQAAMAAAASL